MKVFTDEAPIYLQLRKHIEELILERTLPEEAPIPSIRNMARDYQLNPITVGNALSSLVEEGVLNKKRGVGTFVSKGARELIISERSKDFFSDQLEPLIRKARQLELSKGKVIELINTVYGGKDE